MLIEGKIVPAIITIFLVLDTFEILEATACIS